MKKIFSAILISLFLAGCDDLINPAKENIKDESVLAQEPAMAEGILVNGYTQLPFNESYAQNGGYGFANSDIATDDAVTNDLGNSFKKMAEGSWASDNNPLDMWSRCNSTILYMNYVLATVDEMNWASDPQVNQLFKMRIKGEAYGLRALYMYYLLQTCAGKDVSGNLLGVPILRVPAGQVTDFNTARDSFQDCLDFVYGDLEAAIDLLPLDYDDLDVDFGIIPDKYREQGITDVTAYNRVMGTNFRQRMSGRIAKCIRAQMALLAASPAYLDGADESWSKAAEYAADVLSDNNGLDGFSKTGWTWYRNDSETTAITDGSNPAEIVWRHRTLTHTGLSSAPEKQLFPPSLEGNGWVNPTQNLVDAFPMKNGYPITDLEHSGYDKNNPYENRDPRLQEYIVVNGSKVGATNKVMDMINDSKDAVGATSTSTRTGYYVRKLTNPATNLNPSTPATRMMYVARIRYTEIYLIYAEAAFEATKQFDGKVGKATYSAYDVIKAIRQRAGVGGENDPYLESIKGDEVKVRELIHNERRLELCFEARRFWDLRRWKVSKEKLNEPIRGIKGVDSEGHAVYNFSGPYELSDEKRNYQDYMYYGPLPYGEVLKWNNLIQNQGWK